ncbi:hypothetical protein V5O48_005596 [Marasmius crinis-equi]|uniref:Uncharacterized protein n=1 Tax=Marasmius crinis-equi TaxID=585013 RepID=A0ABR3FM02_9AGAR
MRFASVAFILSVVAFVAANPLVVRQDDETPIPCAFDNALPTRDICAADQSENLFAVSRISVPTRVMDMIDGRKG